jgi:hypothetical protein
MREKNHQKSTSSDNEEQQDELDPSLAISAEPAPIDFVAFGRRLGEIAEFNPVITATWAVFTVKKLSRSQKAPRRLKDKRWRVPLGAQLGGRFERQHFHDRSGYRQAGTEIPLCQLCRALSRIRVQNNHQLKAGSAVQKFKTNRFGPLASQRQFAAAQQVVGY